MLAELVQHIQLHPLGRFVVQPCERPTVDPGIAGDITDLELALPNQTGEVAANQVLKSKK